MKIKKNNKMKDVFLEKEMVQVNKKQALETYIPTIEPLIASDSDSEENEYIQTKMKIKMKNKMKDVFKEKEMVKVNYSSGDEKEGINLYTTIF